MQVTEKKLFDPTKSESYTGFSTNLLINEKRSRDSNLIGMGLARVQEGMIFAEGGCPGDGQKEKAVTLVML